MEFAVRGLQMRRKFSALCCLTLIMSLGRAQMAEVAIALGASRRLWR